MKYCPECAGQLVARQIDDVERRVCASSACGFVYWGNPVPVVAALVQVQDKILLARNVQWPSGQFSFIAGYLEHGETPQQAAVREVKEELGLDGQVSDFIGHFSFFQKNQLILAFLVSATGTIKLGDELAETKLLSREEIKNHAFGDFEISAALVREWLKKTAALPLV